MTSAYIAQVTTHIPVIISVIANIIMAWLLQKKSFVAAEFNVLEKTVTRLRDENKNLNQEIGQLKERTDLAPLMKALLDHNAESNRRFDNALQVQRDQSELLKQNTEAIKGLTASHQQLMLNLFPARRRKDGEEN